MSPLLPPTQPDSAGPDKDSDHSPSIAQALAQARAQGLDRVDAQALLGQVLQRDRGWLIAHDEQRLDRAQAQAFAHACAQRADGVPVAYLLGEREFAGLRLRLSPAVLVPRPDTETLVDWALALLPTLGPAPEVIDLGTGSGAIALAVAHHAPQTQVTATDLSADALAIAQANAHDLGLPLRWHQGSWWQAVPAQARYALALSNPPYIAGDDPHLPSLRHEPRLALSPGGDGLDALRALVAGAPAHLQSGGWLLLEHGWDQADAVAALLRQAGFSQLQSRQDLGGQWRCTGGCWRGA